jgi:hypothetical protein
LFATFGVMLAVLLAGAATPGSVSACTPLTQPSEDSVLGVDCNWYTPREILELGIATKFPEGQQKVLLQAEEDSKDLPVYIILPAAFLVPLAVLVIWTFVIRPKGGDGH